MTNDALKAAALKLAKDIYARTPGMRFTEVDAVTRMIERKMQAVAKADRQKIEDQAERIKVIIESAAIATNERVVRDRQIERLEAALREIAAENKAGLAQGIARTALGEDKPKQIMPQCAACLELFDERGWCKCTTKVKDRIVSGTGEKER